LARPPARVSLPGLAPADRASFAWRLPLFDHLALLSAFARISRPQQHGLNATLCAKSGREQVQHTNALLNDRVGEREQLVWNIEAYRLRGLDIDDQLELGRLFNRQIGRFCPSRYPINVFGY
jgi:hypothetical protein